ncbi:MAG: hypothetical protein PVH88_00515 [Ignavibacteria bacterium]|jgi:hypothetical protein
MKTFSNNEVWMKAAVAGSLWAAFEIVIGSFLHNLHLPFTGIIMASIGVILMVSFSVMWEIKDIFWRAGIVCALMKSISPSAVILGPMAGIMLEAAMMQIFVSLLGQNMLGSLVGGIFALLSLLLHQVGSMLLSYGFDFIIILENTVAFALRLFNLKDLEPILVLYFYTGVLALCGFIVSAFGYYVGTKAKAFDIKKSTGIVISGEKIKEYKQSKTRGIGFLFAALATVVAGLFFVSNFGILSAFLFISIFVLVSSVLYPQALKRLYKPSVFLNFIVLIAFSIFFYDYKNSGIQWTEEGFIVGLKMLFRAVMVLAGFSIISIELRNPVIKKFMNDKSVIYGAVQTGFSILPSLISGLPSVKEMISKPIDTVTMRVAEADTFINMNLQNETEN